jgi:hypothetical protein
MYFILIVLRVAQIFSDHLSQANDLSCNSSTQYNMTNFPDALNEFQKQSLSSNENYNCNISMINSFDQEMGTICAQCLNDTQNRSHNGLQFDMRITPKNGTLSYKSRAHFICLFNSSCNRSIINDWIQWQIAAINETIHAEEALSTKNISGLKPFQIYGSSYYNKGHLCNNIIFEQNENRSDFDNNTDPCLTYDYSDASIEREIRSLIRNLTGTVSNIQSTTEFTSLMMDQKKSNYNKYLQWVVIVICSIIILLVIVILVICLIYYKKYRQGYRPTATS